MRQDRRRIHCDREASAGQALQTWSKTRSKWLMCMPKKTIGMQECAVIMNDVSVQLHWKLLSRLQSLRSSKSAFAQRCSQAICL